MWVRSPSQLAGLQPDDWIILPGSKSTVPILAGCASRGWMLPWCPHAARGGAVLGICGGLQMLGETLDDAVGVDGAAPGLGLLPLRTEFALAKSVRHTRSVFSDGMAGASARPWSSLAGVSVSGYEIHHGQTFAVSGTPANACLEVLPGGLGWQNAAGNVLGLYLHGMLEDSAVLQALFAPESSVSVPTLDSVFDSLADFVQQHFAAGFLHRLLHKNSA
jgi:adenosylcobyric acid synthase